MVFSPHSQLIRRAKAVGAGALGAMLCFAVPAITPDAEGRPSQCPSGMVSVDGSFCIDKWEGSLVELLGRKERLFPPYSSVGEHRVRAVSVPRSVPQAYISRDEADLACRASRKRLCTEDEWGRACKGRKRTTFPYGDMRRPGVCNDSGVAPLRTLFSSLGKQMYSLETMNDPRLNQLRGTLSKTGAHPRCTNNFGVFDMVGNLHEWIDDPHGTFRGGYYLDTHINGDGCDYKTTAHNAQYHDYSTGFRCCSGGRTR